MKYTNGRTVKQGDRVLLKHQGETYSAGVVNLFAPEGSVNLIPVRVMPGQYAIADCYPMADVDMPAGTKQLPEEMQAPAPTTGITDTADKMPRGITQ